MIKVKINSEVGLVDAAQEAILLLYNLRRLCSEGDGEIDKMERFRRYNIKAQVFFNKYGIKDTGYEGGCKIEMSKPVKYKDNGKQMPHPETENNQLI